MSNISTDATPDPPSNNKKRSVGNNKTTIYTYNTTILTKDDIYSRVSGIYSGQFKINIALGSKTGRQTNIYYLYFVERLDTIVFTMISQVLQVLFNDTNPVFIRFINTRKDVPYEAKYGKTEQKKQSVAFVDDSD